MLDKLGDHPHTNFRTLFGKLLDAGYYVEILGSDWWEHSGYGRCARSLTSTRVTKSCFLALGTTQISSYFTKHWLKLLTHQTGNYPVTFFVSKPSRITLVELSIINTSYLKLPFGSPQQGAKACLFSREVHRRPTIAGSHFVSSQPVITARPYVRRSPSASISNPPNTKNYMFPGLIGFSGRRKNIL